MERFSGRLRDGDRVVFDDLTAIIETEGGSGAVGRFEVHQGGILTSHMTTDRPYLLELEDGRSGVIRLTELHASDSAGVAFMHFRLEGRWAGGMDRPQHDTGGTTT
jgi:hypothetical protein